MKVKIKKLEDGVKQRAIQKALFHHLSRDQLAGDFTDHEINPEVVNMLRKFDSTIVDEN
jgi:hypothetical protein